MMSKKNWKESEFHASHDCHGEWVEIDTAEKAIVYVTYGHVRHGSIA